MAEERKGKIAAIGTFDGVHRGHTAVLKAMKDYGGEEGLEPVVFTFDRHPLALIAPDRKPSELTPVWKKKKFLKEAGVSTIVVNFDENLRKTTALEWLRQLRDKYEVKALVVGYDNTFGSDGINFSLEDYRKLGRQTGITVLTAEEVEGVSSSAIRKAIASGDVEKAREMLGRPYSITGKVVRGNSLGHTLGFPTANVSLPEGGAIPKPGVYMAEVKILDSGKTVPAMVNIGTRPTVMRGDDIVMEANLIGWTGDLYDKDITVKFIKRLRDEKKFDSIESLKRQLEKDRKEVVEGKIEK